MNISPAELEVMKVLWMTPNVGASEVFERLAKETSWNIRTVKTMLARLVKKQALKTVKEQNRFIYEPLIEEEAYHKSVVSDFAGKMFGGRATPFVAYLAQQDGLSPEDISDLESLLGELKQ